MVAYDVFLVAGQSNATSVGAGRSVALDSNVAGVFQWHMGGPLLDKIYPASEPIVETLNYNWPTEWVQLGGENGSGFGYSFCKLYKAANPAANVLLLPCAVGGTGFTNNRWGVGQDLYARAITVANLAMAQNAGSTLKGILWHQGEADIGIAESTYTSKLQALVSGFRSSISTGANCKFIAGRMVSQFQPTDPATNAMRQTIVNAVASINRSAMCDLAGSNALTFSSSYNNIHYNAAGCRAMGQLYYTAWVNLV